jgi:hypothetical protein
MKDTSCLEWDGFHATEHACATSAHAAMSARPLDVDLHADAIPWQTTDVSVRVTELEDWKGPP